MQIDYILAMLALTMFSFSVVIGMSLIDKKQLPQKQIDSLMIQDTLTQSLNVLGIGFSKVWVIAFTFSMSILCWQLMGIFFPEAKASKLIISLILFIGIIISIIDLGQYILDKFELQFIDYIETVQTCLQTGLSLQQALEFSQSYAGSSIRKQTQLLTQKLALSSDAKNACLYIVNQYNCESVRLFTHCIITHRESHCNLNDMLQSICEMLSRRTRDKQQVKSKLSGTKYAAIFSGLLPYCLVPIFNYKDPTWFEPLFADPNGIVFLTVAFLCQLFGFLWLRVSLKVAL